jgi:hypothetical protein
MAPWLTMPSPASPPVLIGANALSSMVTFDPKVKTVPESVESFSSR